MTQESRYIVALDQGTTSSRSIIFDHDAKIVGISQREFTQIYPGPVGSSMTPWKSGQPRTPH